MSTELKRRARQGGYVLLSVVVLAAAGATLAFALLDRGINQMKVMRGQEALEEALFVAEGGCHMCLAHIMDGRAAPASITGSIGGGTYKAKIDLMGGTAIQTYTLCSTGFVRNARRVITMDYVRSRSWAEYALWYSQSGVIYFITGDRFKGRVHCNVPVYIQTGNAPVFEKLLSSSSTTWGQGPESGVFSNGYQLGVARESMAAINFTNTVATQDCLSVLANVTLTGATTVAMSGTNFYISNTSRGWTNYNYGGGNPSVMTNGVLYVKTGASSGDLTISGSFKGRMTIVAEGTINITNHIRYSSNPATNPASRDALGLITRKDIIVKNNCPANLDIYAHLIAEGGATSTTNDGMFTVENYDTRARSSCLNLNVYGGIVQNYRGAVGTSGSPGTGYLKNYVFDTRFATNPPPRYPVVGDRYYWGGWRDAP